MEYYVALSGEKVGPLTQYKLAEMLREGEISADQKVWHKGMENWLPMSEVPSLKSTIDSITNSVEKEKETESDPPLPQLDKRTIEVAQEVRPLPRFFARYFDYTVVFVVLVVFSDFEFPKVADDVTLSDVMAQSWKVAESEEYLRLMRQFFFFSIPIWHVIEGIMISVFGTTMGKSLFGIHVLTDSGSKVSLFAGIYRSFLVYILGVGLFCFPLVTIGAMTFSFFRLLSRGICPWDQLVGLRVNQPPLSFGRILLAILAFIVLMMMQNFNLS